MGFAARNTIFGNNGSAIGLAGVVHKETTVRCILRMKRQAQQTLLATADNKRAYIQIEAGCRGPGLHDQDSTRLLHNKLSIRTIVSMG